MMRVLEEAYEATTGYQPRAYDPDALTRDLASVIGVRHEDAQVRASVWQSLIWVRFGVRPWYNNTADQRTTDEWKEQLYRHVSTMLAFIEGQKDPYDLLSNEELLEELERP
jgi:hypothetical protein